MSADNWTDCLNCAKLADADIESRAEALKQQYGKVTEAEYRRLSEELSAMRRQVIRNERPNTFREDWEISGAETGTVVVSYSGHCHVCSFGIDFEVKREIPDPEEARP